MKIICIGRNYADHAKELGNDRPTSPVFFLKPDTALLKNNAPFYLPDFSKNVHYEVELVVKINRVGKSIKSKFSNKYYNEIGLGVDFTARDLQDELKSKGLPWEKSKSFDDSAVISNNWFKVDQIENMLDCEFHLTLNNKTVQVGNTKEMLFNIDEIISHVSQFITLKVGDLIYTGTPKGVGKVDIGDELKGYLNNEKMFDFKVK